MLSFSIESILAPSKVSGSSPGASDGNTTENRKRKHSVDSEEDFAIDSEENSGSSLV